jgi:exonuclease SbcD
MRILHTSDWHIGRTFHGTPTLGPAGTVFDALAEVVRGQGVDVVAIAGDVFDTASPSREAYTLLGRVLGAIRDAGAEVVLISGNHDAAERLGFLTDFTARAGVYIRTRAEDIGVPVVLRDAHGPVHIYGIPYLEPVLLRHRFPHVPLRSQEDAMRFAVDLIRAGHPPGVRSVVLAHTFVSAGARTSDSRTVGATVSGTAGRAEESDGSDGSAGSDGGIGPDTYAPRDFTQGGVDVVPLDVFDGFSYVALGHLHGRAKLAENIRYCGAPLYYSFTEEHRPRGAWLVDLAAGGLAGVSWIDLPIPRALATLTGTIEALLTDTSLAPVQDAWVSAVLTNVSRPMAAMSRLRTRFPHCVQVVHRPPTRHDDGHSTYSSRIKALSDEQIIAAFLVRVRNGEGPSAAERSLINSVLADQRALAGSI